MRVHKMYSKVKEASMLSVRPEVVDPKKGQQPSLLQKLESKFKTASLHFDLVADI